MEENIIDMCGDLRDSLKFAAAKVQELLKHSAFLVEQSVPLQHGTMTREIMMAAADIGSAAACLERVQKVAAIPKPAAHIIDPGQLNHTTEIEA